MQPKCRSRVLLSTERIASTLAAYVRTKHGHRARHGLDKSTLRWYCEYDSMDPLVYNDVLRVLTKYEAEERAVALEHVYRREEETAMDREQWLIRVNSLEEARELCIKIRSYLEVDALVKQVSEDTVRVAVYRDSLYVRRACQEILDFLRSGSLFAEDSYPAWVRQNTMGKTKLFSRTFDGRDIWIDNRGVYYVPSEPHGVLVPHDP